MASISGIISDTNTITGTSGDVVVENAVVQKDLTVLGKINGGGGSLTVNSLVVNSTFGNGTTTTTSTNIVNAGNTLASANIRDALTNATLPTGANPYATRADITIAGGAVPGGSVTGAVQFRSSTGTFTADDNFTYEQANKRLKIASGAAYGQITQTADMTIESTGNVVVPSRFLSSLRAPYDATFYVSTQGNDTTGTGSCSNPYLTITKALTIGMPLYTKMCVNVAAGTYTEDIQFPNSACSVTIIGEAIPQSDFGASTQADIYSTILTGNLTFISGTVDSQLSLKYINYNFALGKQATIGYSGARGPLLVDSCYFSRQTDLEELNLIYTSGIAAYFRNTTFARADTADTTSALLFLGSGANFENCYFQGRVVTNGIINFTNSCRFDRCNFVQSSASTTLASPILVASSTTTSRTFSARQCYFETNRGAILDNQRTAACQFNITLCEFSMLQTIASTTLFLIMNSAATACTLRLAGTIFNNMTVMRSRIYDPTYYTISTVYGAGQDMNFADFGLTNVNTITGTSNTPLTITSSGTGSVDVTSPVDINLNPVGSVVVGSGNLNMNQHEIHNCALIHSQNNVDIVVEGKGTADVILKTNGVNRFTLSDLGVGTFSALPECSVVPTTGNQLVNKTYIDGVIGAGSYVPRIVATGGDSISDYYMDGIKYRCHRFTTVGTSTLTFSSVLSNATIDMAIIGGGGKGGSSPNGPSGAGGGGGAGCFIFFKNVRIAIGTPTLSVTVGAGGTVGSGGASYVGASVTPFGALGGAKGGDHNVTGTNASPSGFQNESFQPGLVIAPSGGGGGGNLKTGGTAVGGVEFAKTFYSDQCYGGGHGGSTGGTLSGGGGGGSSSLGNLGVTNIGGNGGNGYTLIFDDVVRQVCGGGAGGGTVGGGSNTYGGGEGGSGNANGFNGTANTGGGGGGGSNLSVASTTYVGGNGGSGLVLIRYPIA